MNTRWRPALIVTLIAAAIIVPAVHAPPARGVASSAQAQSPSTAPVRRVASIAVTVSDLDRSVQWYRTVLDAEPLGERPLEGEWFERLTGVFGARARAATLRIGSESIELIQFITPRGRPVPADSRGNDLWFQHVAVIVRDMGEAYERLDRHGVTHASQGPQRLPDWNANAAGIRAFYFRDPDGHYLEILEFPEGKGQQRWQSNDRLFLGIDHTAIVVDDTESSLGFYRGMLGLKVAGESENYGPEQERLNSVFSARLRITTLRPPIGPAIELLEYLTPRDGRPTPIDSRPTDLWHWHVVIAVESVEPFFHACRAAGGQPISPGPQPWPHGDHAGALSLMARDPDGHAIMLVDTP